MTSSKSAWRTRLAFHGPTWLLLVAATALAYPTWLSQKPMALDDLGQLNGPQRTLMSWFYQHGHLPLWNPFSFAGQPFLAAGQSGPLYLPNAIYLALPIATALKVSYLLHEVLAALGMYAVVWHFTRQRLAAFAGAITFVTCGFLIGHEIHTQMFDAFCWLPLCFWLLLRLLDAPSFKRVCALAGAFAMEVYAGHPQVTFYVCLVLSIYTLMWWLSQRTRASSSALCHAFLAFVLGLGLSAAQWLPTLDLSNYSDRAVASASFLLQGSLSLSALTQFLTPLAAGGGYSGTPFSSDTFLSLYGIDVYWEFLCYAGVVALTLATAVCFTEFRRHRQIWMLAGLCVFSFGLALGANTWLLYVLTDVPGFDLFRIPARYIGITDFVLAILAGIAIGRLRQPDNHRLRLGVSIVAVIYAIACIGLRLFGPLQHAPLAAVLVPIGLLLATALLCLIRFRRRPNWSIIGVAVLVVADGLSQAYGLSTLVLKPSAPYNHASPAETYLAHALQGTSRLPYPFGRAASFDQTSVSQDRALALRIPMLNGEDSLVPSWYNQSIDLTWNDFTLLQQPVSLLNWLDVKYVATVPGDTPLAAQSTGASAWSGQLPSIRSLGGHGLAAVHVQVSSDWTAFDQPMFSITLQSGKQALQQTVTGPAQGGYFIAIPSGWPQNLPIHVRIEAENRTQPFTLDSVRLLDGSQSKTQSVHLHLGPPAWKLVMASSNTWLWKNPTPLRAAWVTPDARAPGLQSTDQTRLLKWSPNRQVWQVSGATAGWFVLSQMYDPNWTATVIHKTTPGRTTRQRTGVKPIASVLTSVPVPAGTSTIVLRYRPVSVRLGFLVTLVGLVATSALLAWEAADQRRKRPR